MELKTVPIIFVILLAVPSARCSILNQIFDLITTWLGPWITNYAKEYLKVLDKDEPSQVNLASRKTLKYDSGQGISGYINDIPLQEFPQFSPVDDFSVQGISAQGFSGQGISAQDIAAQGISAQGFLPQGTPPQAHSVSSYVGNILPVKDYTGQVILAQDTGVDFPGQHCGPCQLTLPPSKNIQGIQGPSIQGQGIQGQGIQGQSKQEQVIQGPGIQGPGIQGSDIQGQGLIGQGIQRPGTQGLGIQGPGIPGQGKQSQITQGNGIQAHGPPQYILTTYAGKTYVQNSVTGELYLVPP